MEDSNQNMTPDQWAEFLSKVASIIVGSIPGVAAVLLFLLKFTRKFDIYLIEHEMLIKDYAESKGIEVADLPTRSRH